MKWCTESELQKKPNFTWDMLSLFMFVTWRDLCVCVTYSCIRETWLIHMWDVTHSLVCATWRHATCMHVVSQVRMSHVSHMNETCHTCDWRWHTYNFPTWLNHVSRGWVMPNIKESCPKLMSHTPYGWVTSYVNESCHIWTIHISHTNEPCDVWVNHITYTNEDVTRMKDSWSTRWIRHAPYAYHACERSVPCHT